jgi:O-antigen ligase
VGLLHAKTRRARIMYGLSACIILAAGLSTDEKTSLVAPLIGIIGVVAFRPRLSTKLLPLVVVMIIAAHVLAPGAIGSVTEQFGGSRLGAVGTTQHRQDGYDAIRPLVWGYPILGMGYGSYNGVLNRILDNQMLDNLINTGVVGEVVYVMMPLVVLWTALPLIRARRNEHSRDALACGVSAIVFLTVSIIFDDMSFPHVPYIFLTSSAFVAVLYQQLALDRRAAAPAASTAPALAATSPV